MKAKPLFLLAAAALFAGCLAPGVEIQPAPTDFAFVEIQLQG
jgi:uncharacterized lipoprotein YajG